MVEDTTTPVPADRSDRPIGERITRVEARQDIFEASTASRLKEGAVTFGELRDSIAIISGKVSADIQRVEERVAQGEDRQVKRLEDMAEKMAKKLDELAPKRIRPLEIFAFATAVGSMIWTLARNPDRSEFVDVRNQLIELQMRDRLGARDVEDLKASFRRIEDATKRTP